MVWPHHQGHISSKNMAGTGIWRCKNACFFSWALPTKVSVPCSVNLKVSNAIRKLSASIGLNCGHWGFFKLKLNQSHCLNATENVIHLEKCYHSQSKLNRNDFIYSFTEHDQTSKGRSFQLASRLPPLSAQRTKSMVAHAKKCLLGSTWLGGI